MHLREIRDDNHHTSRKKKELSVLKQQLYIQYQTVDDSLIYVHRYIQKYNLEVYYISYYIQIFILWLYKISKQNYNYCYIFNYKYY